MDAILLEPLVVLKIIKHARDSLPSPVSGQLLGMDVDRTLEVTNCFPFPSVGEADDERPEEQAAAEYSFEMLRSLREVNVDHNIAGWYCSVYLGNFDIEGMIETQASYQESNRSSVCILCDPVRTNSGSLWIKAVRLSDSFFSLLKRGEALSLENLAKAGISSSNIFEEVPIKFHNAHLMRILLSQLESNTEAQFERLDLTSSPFIEKQLEFVNECIDDVQREQVQFQQYQRNLLRQQTQQASFLAKRRAENEARKRAGEEPLPDDDLATNPIFKPLPEPSRLPSLLLTHQINSYCSQMNSMASESLTKLFLSQAIQTARVAE